MIQIALHIHSYRFLLSPKNPIVYIYFLSNFSIGKKYLNLQQSMAATVTTDFPSTFKLRYLNT